MSFLWGFEGFSGCILHFYFFGILHSGDINIAQW